MTTPTADSPHHCSFPTSAPLPALATMSNVHYILVLVANKGRNSCPRTSDPKAMWVWMQTSQAPGSLGPPKSDASSHSGYRNPTPALNSLPHRVQPLASADLILSINGRGRPHQITCPRASNRTSASRPLSSAHFRAPSTRRSYMYAVSLAKSVAVPYVALSSICHILAVRSLRASP